MYNNFPFPQPYQNQATYPSQGVLPNRQGIIRVHGQNGAEAYPMRPNDEVLLLDDTQAVVWLKQTDGAGYPTLNGYDVTPMKTREQVSEDKYALFDKRLTKLEEIINAKPDTTKQSNGEGKKSD